MSAQKLSESYKEMQTPIDLHSYARFAVSIAWIITPKPAGGGHIHVLRLELKSVTEN
jgi:hypothetical protein